METNPWYWIGFNAFVLIMLALDLGVFHKKTHEVKVKEALIWTAVWIALAMVFTAGIFHFFGKGKGVAFLTGYVVEKSLSVDNIFVFIMVFSYFQIPTKYQHKVLFWGVLGALVMRAIFIFAGVALISKFHWIIYIFGGFLIFTGFKMLFQEDKPIEPEKNPLIKLVRKILPVSNELHGDKFIIKQGAKTIATPLLLVLVLIEFTDLIFAVDSIPAILAISKDPFIVYTSNVFAIMGLRSLYFALSGITQYFVYLKYGLAAILIFVGTKMSIVDFYKVPVLLSLLIIVTILAISVIASLMVKSTEDKKA